MTLFADFPRLNRALNGLAAGTLIDCFDGSVYVGRVGSTASADKIASSSQPTFLTEFAPGSFSFPTLRRRPLMLHADIVNRFVDFRHYPEFLEAEELRGRCPVLTNFIAAFFWGRRLWEIVRYWFIE